MFKRRWRFLPVFLTSGGQFISVEIQAYILATQLKTLTIEQEFPCCSLYLVKFQAFLPKYSKNIQIAFYSQYQSLLLVRLFFVPFPLTT